MIEYLTKHPSNMFQSTRVVLSKWNPKIYSRNNQIPLNKLSPSTKFFTRPNIKGPTREKRSLSIFKQFDKPFEPNKNIFSLVHNYSTSKIVQQSRPVVEIISPAIAKDLGLKLFLKKVYLHSGLGFAGTLTTGLLISPLMISNPPLMIGGFVASIISAFGSIYAFSRTAPQFTRQTVNHFGKEFTTVVPVYQDSKYISLAILYMSMGIIISPIVAMTGPLLVAQAAGISVAITAGSTAYALFAKPGSLLPYKSVMYGCLTGFVGINLLSLAGALIFGRGDFFDMMHSFDIYGGLVLFTALNAVDTHTAIESYEKAEPDHLGHSINSGLNAINIFIRVLEILNKMKK